MAELGRSTAHLESARYFPALDGLRALSVLGVIAYHAEVPALPGGFLGVEVFFVISGYLITSLLLLEQMRNARVSLAHFWWRRARRLLPALFALLFVVNVLAPKLVPEAIAETRSDTVAALLYVSNWWQIVHRHSYFMAVERPPLLRHLWSLAVEEQFYLGFPLLVAALARTARRAIAPLALGIALASACWLAWSFDPQVDLTRVYVGTDTRSSGLLLGAALAAVSARPFSALPASSWFTSAARELVPCLGLGALLVAFTQLHSQDAILFRGGLVLIDLATCALIIGVVSPTFVSRVLGVRPLAWLGRRSYGLYLWHWPVFALTRPEQDLELSSGGVLALRLALTFALSEACFRFIETPVRRGTLPQLAQRLRARPILLGASLGAFVALFGSASTSARANIVTPREAAPPAVASLPASTTTVDSASAPAHGSTLGRGIPLDPSWPKTLTLLTDSVTLAVSKTLPEALPGWKVEVLGRPALMVKQVVPEFLRARSVGSVVVVGLAYNSLFEKDRKNFERWSGVWDKSAEHLLSDLKACGAKKIVWVTLRDPSPELVTEAGREQYQQYAWFFPYVNERLFALAERHPELALADWRAVSNVPGLTKDLIHLDPAGVSLMTTTITRAVLGPEP